MRVILIYILFVIMVPKVTVAQESNLGNWVLLFGNKKLNSKLNWHHELQYRNYDIGTDLEQLLLRTGLGMNIKENANLLLGYGFIRSENYIGNLEKTIVNEHRIYQQFITRQAIGKLKLQHRYRFEQRFVEDDFKLRLRYFLGLNYPFWKNVDGNKSVYLSIYNEIFLNTKQSVFDRNRLYGGLGYRLNQAIRFEFGYMNQFLNNGNRDQLNMVCFYNW